MAEFFASCETEWSKNFYRQRSYFRPLIPWVWASKALVEADAENARTRAQRLRMLAKFTVGEEKQMLMQANLEEGSAKTYEAIAQRMRKEFGP